MNSIPNLSLRPYRNGVLAIDAKVDIPFEPDNAVSFNKPLPSQLLRIYLVNVSLEYVPTRAGTSLPQRAKEKFNYERISKSIFCETDTKEVGHGVAFTGSGLRPRAMANSRWLASFLERTVVFDVERYLFTYDIISVKD